ncbi:WSC domain-containing protein, partial [Mycena latifolia]
MHSTRAEDEHETNVFRIFLPFVLLPGALAASNVPRQIQARALSTAAPGPWAAQGCYTDKIAERTLPDAKYRNANMSIDMCIAFCGALDFPYAGVEYRIECYCGNTLNPIGALENPADCNAQCPGNAGQACGADYRLQVYLNVPPVPPSTPASIGKDSRWKSAGCYTDSVSARTFPNGTSIIGGMTAEKCTSTCQANGFTYAGTEYSRGKPPLSLFISSRGCDMPCSGNATQICGGGNRLTVYQDHPPTPI